MSVEQQRLEAAGISGAALSTTLPRLDQQVLREMIQNGAFEVTSAVADGTARTSYRGAAFYCDKEPYHKVRRVAEVFAKELVLIGYRNVRLTTLTRILDAVEYEDDYYLEVFRGHTVIRDFYVAGTDHPFTGRMLQRIQSVIVDLMDRGYAFTFVAAADTPPEQWGWYGDAFLKTIATENIVVGV